MRHKAFSPDKHHKLTKDFKKVSAAIPTDLRAASFSELWDSWFYHQHAAINKLFTHVVLHGTHILTFKLVHVSHWHCTHCTYFQCAVRWHCRTYISCIHSFFVLLFCLFYCVILFSICLNIFIHTGSNNNAEPWKRLSIINKQKQKISPPHPPKTFRKLLLSDWFN